MKQKKETDNLEIFRSAPIWQAVLKNTVPAMMAMLMVLIYNLADTFFIGRTGNALMVAAVSLSTPVFMMFMTIGTIFGIGGTSVISRAMGAGERERGKKVCAFCMWGCVCVSIIMMILILSFMDPILRLIGASEDTLGFAKQYLSIVTVAGPFVMISNCFANIIRTEGKAGLAMLGQMGGNLLNVILDPILILGLGWNVAGAAAATAVSNIVSSCYYLSYFKWGHSILSIRPRDISLKDNIPGSVFAIGIPAALGSLCTNIAHILSNNRMAGYGDMALAGSGVALKITMITGMLCIGLGQGAQPLLGYCVGAGNWDRYKKSLRFSVRFALIFSASMTVLCFIFSSRLVSAFLSDPDAFGYALTFLRILLSTSFLFGVYYVLTYALQAMGAATAALITNISRQGLIFIPALFILESVLGVYGLICAQPVADVLSLFLVIVLYRKTIRKRSGAPSPRANAAEGETESGTKCA